MSVAGDLRFLSHHDVMRAMERAVARAGLSVVFSEGFNPRPRMSLVLPRPVGAASLDDLLVLSLSEAVAAPALCAALNDVVPPGMRLFDATPLPPKATPAPIAVRYMLDLASLTPADRQVVASRVAGLEGRERWPVERPARKPRRRGRAEPKAEMHTTTVDLRGSVNDITMDADELRWTQHASPGQTARAGDVLRLLGLDPHGHMAAVTRQAVDYRLPDGSTLPRANGSADNPSRNSWHAKC